MAEPMDLVDGPADAEEMDTSVPAGSADQGIEDFEITGFAQGEFTYQLGRFKEQVQEGKAVNSDEFEIAGYSWGLLVYPGGNTQSSRGGPPMKHISVYLDCPEAPVLPHQLMPRADFTLTVINHLDPANNIKKDTSHRFTQKEVDWGFTQFMPLADALDESKGFLVNDTITIKVEIKVQLDEKFTGATRKTTGFVGLKNQGATCYMNSLLQMLFHMPRFRQAVYHMPTAEDEDPRSSISLALQSLFFRLQYSHTPVSTKDLIQSFGWNTMDAFQQHDVEELELKLCEKLEEKMKGTKVDKTINRLLMGKFFNYIECKNVDYKSTRTEDFLDIQLDIMGCRDLYQSFDKIVEVETMEGDNKYHAEGHGLQDARKGVLLESLPPILQLHLKRFDYDRQTWMPIKVNDRYEFYEELDLDKDDGKYLSQNCDRSIRNMYKLHSVLVHSGGSHGGHYYAYIRPDGKQFYKFDDESVTKEDSSAAIEGQFGGEDEPVQPLTQMSGPMRMKMKNVSNAYMLVYVRATDWDFVMCDAGAQHLMEHVSKRLKAEQSDKERKRREKLQAHRFVTIRVVTDEDIATHIRDETFDLVKLDELCPAHTLKVPKTDTWAQVAAQIEALTGIAADMQAYWRWQMRSNSTFRPSELLEVNPDERIKVKHRALVKQQDHPRTSPISPMKATTLQPIDVYLTRRPPTPPQHQDVLMFIKIYHPEQKQLVFWKSQLVPLNCSMAKLAEHIQHQYFKGTLEYEDSVDLYEEVRTDKCMIEAIDLRENPQMLKSQHGDIIVAQPRLSAEEQGRCEFPTVMEYLKHLHSLRRINFLPMGESAASASGTLLELPKDADYATVVQQLAHAINCPNPDLLCLTLHNAYTNLPQLHHVKYNEPFVSTTCASAASVQTVYYEVLDMPLPQVEQLKTMSVTVVKESMELFKTSSFRVPKESTIQYLLDLVRKDLDPGFAGGRPLRLVKVLDGRIYDVLPPNETVVDLNSSYWELRAEPIPDDDSQALAEAGDSARRFTVSHFLAEKNQPQHYGDPLVVILRPNETLPSLKARMLKRLKIAPEEFATWKWYVIAPQAIEELHDNNTPVLEVWDHAVHAASSTPETCYIGMLHETKNFRRPPRQSHINATEAQIKLH